MTTGFDDNDDLGMDPKTFSEICMLLDRGDAYLEEDDYASALETFEDALSLLPKETSNWALSLNIWTAIGETLLFMKEYERARFVLADLMHDQGALGNPYIHLRLGQAQYELGNMWRARDELVRAYFTGGEDIFEGEDPKYFEVVKAANLRPPAV